MIVGHTGDNIEDSPVMKELIERLEQGECKLAMIIVDGASGVDAVQKYIAPFDAIGIDDIEVVHIVTRADAQMQVHMEMLDRSTAIFITGSDPRRITSQLGGSLLYNGLDEWFTEDKTLIGLGAGAGVMSELMVDGKQVDNSNTHVPELFSGLGFVKGVIVDVVFDKIDRLGRMLGALAQNPRSVGIGIEEDTAIVMRGNIFEVAGSHAIYVVDGTSISYTNLNEKRDNETLTLSKARLHMLGAGSQFDVAERRLVIGESFRIH